MYKYRHHAFYILMIMAIIFEIKGHSGAVSIWNLWSLTLLAIFIFTVIFAVKYDLRINPFRKIFEPQKTKTTIVKTNENAEHGKYGNRSLLITNRAACNSDFEQEKVLINGNPSPGLGQLNEVTKLIDPDDVQFTKEFLSYNDEPDDEQQKKLQEICNIRNSFYRGLNIFKIEDFKMTSQYSPYKYRWINKEGDIWLYFVSCTDGTHAPADYREVECLDFCYKGAAVELYFEEQRTSPKTFELKSIGVSDPEIHDLQTFLSVNEISPDGYYGKLRTVLDQESYARIRRTGYYVL